MSRYSSVLVNDNKSHKQWERRRNIKKVRGKRHVGTIPKQHLWFKMSRSGWSDVAASSDEEGGPTGWADVADDDAECGGGWAEVSPVSFGDDEKDENVDLDTDEIAPLPLVEVPEEEPERVLSETPPADIHEHKLALPMPIGAVASEPTVASNRTAFLRVVALAAPALADLGRRFSLRLGSWTWGVPRSASESQVTPVVVESLDTDTAQAEAEDVEEEVELVPLGDNAAAETHVVDNTHEVADLRQAGLVVEQFARIADCCAGHPLQKDSLAWKMCDYQLFSKQLGMGIEAEAAHLGTHRAKSLEMLSASALASLAVWRRDAFSMCASLVKGVQAAGGRLLVWTEQLRYDETPMRTRVVDGEAIAATPFPRDNNSERRIVDTTTQTSLPVVSMTCEATHIAKILQTERHYSMLVHLPQEGYQHIVFSVPCWLQSLSRTTGEAYMNALNMSALDGDAELAAAFARKQRVVCTDGASSCARHERVQEKSTGRPALSVLCEIHKVYHWFQSVFGTMSKHTARLHDVAKVLQAGDAMRTFRLALRTFLTQNLEYKPQSRPRDSDIRRNIALLDTFLPAASRTNRLRRATILALANGDWRRRGTFEHHCWGCCRNEAHCVQKLATTFVACVASCAPPSWPESRWTGFDLSIEWQGLLEAIHGALSCAFMLWCDNLSGRAAGSDVDAMPLAPPSSAMQEDIERNASMGGSGLDLGGSSGSGAQADAPEGFGNADGSAGNPSAQSPEDLRVEAAKRRGSAKEWLSAPRLPIFVLLRRVADPLVSTMRSLLDRASDDIGVGGVASASDSHQSASPEALDPNKFHMLAAATGAIEEKCLDEVRALMRNAEVWGVMPDYSRTAAMRTRAFIMLSTTGCHCWEMAAFHDGYPFCLFLLLTDPATAAQRVLDECPDRYDKWSASFVAYHKDRPGCEPPFPMSLVLGRSPEVHKNQPTNDLGIVSMLACDSHDARLRTSEEGFVLQCNEVCSGVVLGGLALRFVSKHGGCNAER